MDVTQYLRNDDLRSSIPTRTDLSDCLFTTHTQKTKMSRLCVVSIVTKTKGCLPE